LPQRGNALIGREGEALGESGNAHGATVLDTGFGQINEQRFVDAKRLDQ
jgi:hypothetical protein